ncbi:unnamed protein product [Meganyctiphanes norvegica]|uniref:Platelet-derived growth factor (PDGF) family profile domain-containing protein n=1 Tax=Meganyctiphanes norvegica TaxID=48144 RepID=A0AAV2RI96_MEGNR
MAYIDDANDTINVTVDPHRHTSCYKQQRQVPCNDEDEERWCSLCSGAGGERGGCCCHGALLIPTHSTGMPGHVAAGGYIDSAHALSDTSNNIHSGNATMLHSRDCLIGPNLRSRGCVLLTVLNCIVMVVTVCVYLRNGSSIDINSPTKMNANQSNIKGSVSPYVLLDTIEQTSTPSVSTNNSTLPTSVKNTTPLVSTTSDNTPSTSAKKSVTPINPYTTSNSDILLPISTGNNINPNSTNNDIDKENDKLFRESVDALRRLLPCEARPVRLPVKKAIMDSTNPIYESTNTIYEEHVYPEVIVVMRCGDHNSSFCGTGDIGQEDSSKKCTSTRNKTRTHTVMYYSKVKNKMSYHNITTVDEECKCLKN